MAALVQSFPPPASPISMLQTRPSSSEAFQSGSQGQQHQRNPQVPRNIYNTSVGGMAAGNYRGHTSTPPVSPYGLASPQIPSSGPNPLRQHPTATPPPRLENRTSSAPSIPLAQSASQPSVSSSSRPRPPPVHPIPTSVGVPNTHSLQQHTSSKEDSSILTPPLGTRPLSTVDLNPPPQQMASYANVAKSSPDRYRRNHRRAETSGTLSPASSAQGGSAMPSGSGMATVGHLYTHPTQTSSTPTLSTYPSYLGTQTPSSPLVNDYNYNSQPRQSSKDDLNLQRERQATSDLAKRYRRRSISSMEAKDFAIPLSEPPSKTPSQPKTYAAMLAGPPPQEKKEVRVDPPMELPSSAHGRNGSNESSISSHSSIKQSSVSWKSLNPYC